MGFLQPPQINWSQDDISFLQGASSFEGVWEPGEFNGPLPDMEPDLREEAVPGDFLFWSRNLDNMISDKKRMTIQGLVDLVSGAIVIPSGLPDGGTTGQALIKASNDDQDVEWGDLPAGFSGSYLDLTDVPSTFPPESHTHAYSSLTGIPSTFTPSAHTHPFAEVTGLTPGSVPFAGPTGILSQDNQNFYFDDAIDNFLISNTLGSDLVTNGNFASGTGWTAPTGWTISSGVATHGSNGTGALTPSTAIVIYAGQTYFISIDISGMTTGTATIAVGGVTIATVSVDGTYTRKIVATATTNLTITPSNTARFSVDNVSVKRLSGGALATGSFYGEFFQCTRTGLGATTAPGNVLDNPTPATASVMQASPSNVLRGRGWNSSGSASWPFEIQDYAIGSANITPHGKWIQQWRGNSGTWATFFAWDSNPLGTGFEFFPSQGHSNGTPGTTRLVTFSNTGSHTWLDFNFSGVTKANIGADSGGELKLFAGGGNYFGFYSRSGFSLFAYLYPNAFVHSSGHGSFQFGVNAGNSSNSTPPSKLTTHGRFGGRSTYINTNTTLDDTYYVIAADGDSNNICTGTPTYACSHWTSEGDCNARNYHTGCTWNPGSSCSAFSYESGMSTCNGTSGCSADTAACTGGDETTCLSNDDSYGGSCSWGGNDCSVLDEGTCGSYSGSGCTQNYGDCSSFNSNESGCSGQSGCSVNTANSCPSQMDEGSCTGSGCTWDGMSCTGDNSTCTGTYYTGCSGTYYTCSGTYYTGNCSGTYGSGCSGTSACTGVAYADCLSEAGCSQSSGLSLTFPTEGIYSTGFYAGYKIRNIGSTATITMIPNTGQGIKGTATIAPGVSRVYDFAWVQVPCQTWSGTNSTTCTSGHSGCTWTACSSFGDETSCNNEGGNCSWDSGGGTCVGTGNCTGTFTPVRHWLEF